MRWTGSFRWVLVAAVPAVASLAHGAGPAAIAVTELHVAARARVPDLQCAAAPKKAPPARPPDTDPAEVPDEAMVQEELQAQPGGPPGHGAFPPGDAPLGRARPGEPYRVAVWGDSHLASGAFTGELVRLLKVAPDRVGTALIPATMNRSGVRLPLRKSCLGPAWRYEPAYVAAPGAQAPGPGLVNLVAAKAGATVAWDLRTAAGQPAWRELRVLFQQAAEPLRFAVSVDGAPDVEIAPKGEPGPAALHLLADAPLSTVRVKLLAGKLRLHGLALPDDPAAALHLDLFAYPGATVAGWDQAQPDYLAAWYRDRRYDLVVLAFGTNEGNVKPFDAAKYERTLRQSVQKFRAQFPDAACVLVSPPDRGVLVRRSEKNRRKQAAGKGRAAAPASRRAPVTDLLQYTRIHEEIGRLQEAAAADHGCRVWSMYEAMGGSGSAYRWAHETPPLMSRDLVHLTGAGYRQLAARFAADLGWSASRLLSAGERLSGTP